MDRYSVQIPYVEPDGNHPDRVYEATIEVAANSPGQARVLATKEFKSLANLSWVKGARQIVEDQIDVLSAATDEDALQLRASDPAPGVTVLAVAGKLDADSDTDFGDKLREICAGPSKKLVIDLSGVAYINSSSIGAIAGCMQDVELRMASLRPGVLRVFKMVGLDSAVQCCESVDEALKSFA